MTVQEKADQTKYNKIWLCPHLVFTDKIDAGPLLTGIDCTKSTIPVELKDKNVTKSFVESSIQCIIWENDDEESILRATANRRSQGEGVI